MNILVTGCCGFIGSNFVRLMLAKHPEWVITNLDKITYAGNQENLKDVENNENYRFVKGDICDERIVAELAKDADMAINFAAESFVDKSIENAQPFINTNIKGTHTLLEAARKSNIKKFIQVSTDEVYGSIEKGSFNENDALRPSSPYSASKAAADLLALSYFTTYNLPVVICRSSNNFGPYQNTEKLIPLFITNAIKGKALPLYGDGMNVRDWLFVDDNCEGIETAATKGKNGQIYNIGSGNEKRNIEITRQSRTFIPSPYSGS